MTKEVKNWSHHQDEGEDGSPLQLLGLFPNLSRTYVPRSRIASSRPGGKYKFRVLDLSYSR